MHTYQSWNYYWEVCANFRKTKNKIKNKNETNLIFKKEDILIRKELDGILILKEQVNEWSISVWFLCYLCYDIIIPLPLDLNFLLGRLSASKESSISSKVGEDTDDELDRSSICSE